MKKTILILVTAFSLLGIALIFYIKSNSLPASSETKTKMFVVNKGDSIVDIANRLEKNELIKNKISFVSYAYFMRLDKKLQAGTFRLKPSSSTQEIIVNLTQGGVNDYWLKIKDGSRIEEVSELFVEYAKADSKEFIALFKDKEGYFYPDSYLIPQYYTVDQIIEVINANFTKKFKQAQENSTNNKLTMPQVLTLASLLEREGRTLESKQMITGIILNRMEAGMPLQIDATVQYVRDSKLPKPKSYWLPLNKKDLSLNSPYNTYQNQGLPPAPICNPGYNSIYAAFHPTSSEYVFYITGNDGQMYYAKTLDEHNSNIRKYLK